MTASISPESFKDALKTIQRIRSKYTPEEGQDYYDNPDAALDSKGVYFLAPLIYWCRDEQALIDDQELWNAIQIVTRHFRDHYHNQGKLEAFEKIIEPLAYDAVLRLYETETPKLPMIYREGMDYFASTLRNNPYYAIGFLAQSTEALADPRNTFGDNIQYINRLLNYVVPYYQDRASVDQAALMLFALDQAINENPMGYSDAAIDGLKAHRDTIQSNTKNRTEEEVAKITEWRANLHEAQAACAVIASQNFQDHPDFIRAGKVLAALGNNQNPETKTATLANPAQWILGTSIATYTLAAFFQVMGNLGSQDALSDDVKTAFQTLRTFSDDVLSSWAANNSFNHSKKFSLQDAIVSNQSTLNTVASAALLEERIEGLEGLMQAIASESSGPEDKQRLIDYAVALSDKNLKPGAPQVENVDMHVRMIQLKIQEGLKGVGSLVLLEKRIQDGQLSDAAMTTLRDHYDAIFDRYKEKQGFELALLKIRAQEAAPSLKTVLGFEQLPVFIEKLEFAGRKAPFKIRKGNDVHGVEKWLLNDSPDAAKVMFLGSMYCAILQDFIRNDSNTPEARNAKTVLTYIESYFEAGGKKSELDTMVQNYFESVLNFADTVGKKPDLLRALTDVVAAGALWREIDDIVINSDNLDQSRLGQYIHMGTCIAFRYIVDGKADLFKAATQNDETQTPVVSAAILEDSYALKGIKDLLPRIEESPKDALWDTAAWLAALQKNRDNENSSINNDPEVKRAAERIEAYIKTKFLEIPELDSLVKDMHKPRKASHSFYADVLLDNLCRDDVDTTTLDPAKYASLILKMQWARDHGDQDQTAAKRQHDAKVLLPFLSKVINRFPEFRSQVDREKTRIQAFIDASRKVSFSNDPEFNDTNGLINAFDSDFDMIDMIKYAVQIQSVLDDIDAGVISANAAQRQDAITFQDHVQEVIKAKGWDHETQPYQKYQRISREKIALKAIVSENLLEFQEIQGALCDDSVIDCEDIFTLMDDEKYEYIFYGGRYGYSQEKVPNFPAKFLVATETALLRRNDLPPRLVQHLEVVGDGILEHWRAWERQGPESVCWQDYLSQHKAFNAVVGTLRAQSDLLQVSQNPACMEPAQCRVA
jgi:hypothetical protein